jgi:hypothetical protein
MIATLIETMIAMMIASKDAQAYKNLHDPCGAGRPRPLHADRN